MAEPKTSPESEPFFQNPPEYKETNIEQEGFMIARNSRFRRGLCMATQHSST
jgi:hypothetical protein